MADKYADTNANPYVDDASNNEAANINTKTVKPKDKLVYQVWLDTTKFDANNKDNIQSVGITDDYDEAKVDVEASAIKAYDGKTGADVTAKFDRTYPSVEGRIPPQSPKNRLNDVEAIVNITRLRNLQKTRQAQHCTIN